MINLIWLGVNSFQSGTTDLVRQPSSGGNRVPGVRAYTTKLADFLNIPLEELPKPIPICGYNGQVR